MKVLFLTHYFPPEGNAPATRVFEMCRRWAKHGHDVTVLTGAPNVPAGVVYPGYRNKLVQREVVEGIRVVRVWTFIAPNRGVIRRSLNYASYMFSAFLAGLFLSRPDVLIATSPQFFCGWAGLMLARLRRLPFILEVRDLWPESISTVGAIRSKAPLRLLEWMEQRLYARARRIVTVGDGYRERLVERGVAKDKIDVVCNGVDRRAMTEDWQITAIRREYGLENTFVVSYIGTIGMACGLDVVLRAAEQLRLQGRDDVRFLLVGDGATRKGLEAQAKSLNLGNVIFAGLQPKERIPALLGASNACLVHLKRQELFKSVLPSKLLEAMAMARPVILGVEGHAAALLKTATAGICIEPGNATELVAAIEMLNSDPEKAAAMGRSGRDYVLQQFDLDVLADKYLMVIENVLAAGAR